MPRPLSMDLAERIASAMIRAEESHPLIAERFSVSVSTVERISRRMREDRPLTRTEHSGGARSLLGEEHHAYIAQQLEETPFVSSYELTERFNAHFADLQVHRSTISCDARSRLQLQKKVSYSPQRDRADVLKERAEFLEGQSEIDVSRVFFIDEAGCHPGIGPRRGWAPVGQRLYAPEEPYSRSKHVSMIGALTLGGIATYMTVDGGVKGDDFQRFVKQRLVPRLRPGDVVCWDNINMHKSKVVIEAVEATGAFVLCLPRYSPDLNPIEAAWAKVKDIIRKAMPTTVAKLKAVMRRALRRVSGSDARGWMKYCGYCLPVT